MKKQAKICFAVVFLLIFAALLLFAWRSRQIAEEMTEKAESAFAERDAAVQTANEARETLAAAQKEAASARAERDKALELADSYREKYMDRINAYMDLAQDWSSLGWTGRMSLQSRGLSAAAAAA